MLDSIIEAAYNARHGYWRQNGGQRKDAILCILFSDLGAFRPAWQVLRYEYKGFPPLRWDALADAIDAVYLAGF